MRPERPAPGEPEEPAEVVRPRWRATSPDQFMTATKAATTPRQLRTVVENFKDTFRQLSNEDKKKPREAWKRRQKELGIRV